MAVQQVFGGSVAWHSEIDENASAILAHHWPEVPNVGDLAAVDFTTVEPVDAVVAGFPCTDLSLAGRMAGIAPGTQSGLWLHVARALEALRPRLVVIENVPGLLSTHAHSNVELCPWCVGDGSDQPALRALGAVLGDLARLGFDATWACVRAEEIGAPHIRRRVFILAVPTDAEGEGLPGPGVLGWARERGDGVAADASSSGRTPGPGLRPHGSSGLGGRRLGDENCQDDPATAVEWGEFRPAIERWERLTRPAPRPTDDHGRLSPRFVEWLMGLPDHHVTGVPGLSRSAQLRALGNGVIPSQAPAGRSAPAATSSATAAHSTPPPPSLDTPRHPASQLP